VAPQAAFGGAHLAIASPEPVRGIGQREYGRERPPTKPCDGVPHPARWVSGPINRVPVHSPDNAGRRAGWRWPYSIQEVAARRPQRARASAWPDTFNNYFHPETARAALRVLETAGYRVVVPQKPLCCDRPLYGFGMLDRAQDQLAEILQVLRPAIAQGVPVVGLEAGRASWARIVLSTKKYACPVRMPRPPCWERRGESTLGSVGRADFTFLDREPCDPLSSLTTIH
jgi:hypothetical protein